MLLLLWQFALWSLIIFNVAAEYQQQRIFKDSGSPLDAEFQKTVNAVLESWHVPGIAIAVVDGDDTWAEGYGIATFPSTAVTPFTLFEAGSTTKAFTAAVMSTIVDDNENFPDIQWTTPISQIIRDDFVLQDEYLTNHITIEDALSHRTGMPRHDISWSSESPQDTVRSLRHLPFTAELRTKFQYCNLMYVTVSHVIEYLTGSWLGDVMQTRIMNPLNMTATYFSTNEARKSSHHLAEGYSYSNGSYTAMPHTFDLQIVGGAGFIVSSVLDYAKWVRAMINESPPISKAGHEALKTSRTLESQEAPFTGPIAYALGWETVVYRGHQVFKHDGGTMAYGAEVFFIPELKWGFISFANHAMRGNAVGEILGWHLIDQKLKVPDKERHDWSKQWHDILASLAYQYDNAKAILYPSVPSPPLPATAKLSAYTGSYFNAGYRSLNLSLVDTGNEKRLYAERTDALMQIGTELEHVSGDFFLAHIDLLKAPRLILSKRTSAEFKIGADGVPCAVGVAFEPAMGGRLIWFHRVDNS